MTPEEKAALEATAKEEAEAQAKADKEAQDAEFEAEIADLSDEEKEAKRATRNAPQHLDYEAELKREREAREKAEKALADRRFKESEQRRKEKEAGGTGDDDEKPLTANQLEEILSRERETTQKEVQSLRIYEIAKGLATSEAERNLIVEIHKNRSFPAHLSLEEQLEEAYAIANRKKLIGERNEALRALRGKDGVNKDTATTHRDAPKAGEPKLSPADQQAIKGAGFSWNGTNRRYEKKLSGGRILVRKPDGSVAIVK